MMTHKTYTRGGLVSLVVLSLLGCSATNQDPNAQPKAEAVVNVYSARHYNTDQVLYDAFTKKTGIKVNLTEVKSDLLLERIKNEGSQTVADVLVTTDAGRLWRAEEAQLLQPIESEALEASIPESLRHPDGLWFGLTQRARVIIYNKDKVKPDQIQTYEDLAQPAWKGRVCIRSSNNIYNQSLLGSMIESKGAEATEAWAKGLVTNLARDPEGGDTDQIKAVAAGQCDVAIANHYYLARMAKSKKAQNQEIASKVGVLFPNQNDRGTHVNVSGAGVVSNAPHKENAIKFLEYLATPEAQQMFADDNNEYPAVTSVKTAAIVKDFGEFKADAVNVSAYGRNNAAAVQIADRVGWK